MLFYRFLLTLMSPALVLVLLWRVLRGREGFADFGERFGGGGGQPGALWLHGASNGELTSARKLVEALVAGFPDRPMVVTANTVSGRDLVRAWGIPSVTAQLAPVDLRLALSRFRRRWQPAALIILENELWPNRIMTACEPVLCVAGRMSTRSAAQWTRVARISRAVLARVGWLSAQDKASADRFVSLGFDPARLGPVISLKPAVDLPPPPAAALEAMSAVFRRSRTVLAASTHEGEEGVILAAFAALRAKSPAMKLILAPRHPRRGAEVEALIAEHGLAYAVRSKGQVPLANTVVYLADSLGEMQLWYAVAGVTIVGGSLVDRGGHTPFEPVKAESAVLHGPYVANFAAAYHSLDSAGAALAVSDAASIEKAIGRLINADEQSDMAAKARSILEMDEQGGLDPIVEAISRALSH